MSLIQRQVQLQIAEPGATDFAGPLLTLQAQLAGNPDEQVITLTPGVRPLEGDARSRPIAFDVLDTANVITADLGDEDGRMLWRGRLMRARILDTVDGVAGAWTSKATGRLARLAQLRGPGLWRIELTDERWVERHTDIWKTDGVLTELDGTEVDVGGTTLIFPGGTAYPGPASYLAPSELPAFVVTETSPLTLVALSSPAYARPGSFGSERVAPEVYRGMEIERSFRVLNELGSPAHLRAILQHIDGGTIDYEATISRLFGPNRGDLLEPNRRFEIVIGSTTLSLSVGDVVRAGIRSWGHGPSKDVPLHVGVRDGSHHYGSASGGGGIDPIDLLEKLYDEAGVRYNAAAMDALRGRYPAMTFRITGPENLGKWIARRIFKPLQIMSFINGDGEVAPKSLRLAVDLDPETLVEITDEHLIPNHPTLDFPSGETVNRIVFKAVRGIAAANLLHSQPDGIDYLKVDELTETCNYPGRALNAPVHEHEIEIHGLPLYENAGQFDSHGPPPALSEVVREIADEVFDLWGDGPATGELHLRPSAPDIEPGDYFLLTAAGRPNPASNAYGTSRIVLALEVEERLNGRRKVQVLDAGANNQPLDVPSLSLGLTAANGEHSVDVTVAGLAAGTHATVHYALSPTEPAADSPLWRPAHTEELSNGVFVRDKLPSGTRVWFRSRARAERRIRSLWSGAVSITTTALSAPGAMTANVIGNSIIVTWPNTETEYPFLPLRAGIPYQPRPIPAGSTAVLFEENPAGANNYGGKYVDPYGGESPASVVSATPAAGLTLEAPSDVRVIQGRDSTGAAQMPPPSAVIGYGLVVGMKASLHAQHRWQLSTVADFSTVEREFVVDPGNDRAYLYAKMDNTLRYARARLERRGSTTSPWSSIVTGYTTALVNADSVEPNDFAGGSGSLRVDENGYVILLINSDDVEAAGAYYEVSISGVPTVTTSDSFSARSAWPTSIATGIRLDRGQTAHSAVRFWGPLAGLGPGVYHAATRTSGAVVPSFLQCIVRDAEKKIEVLGEGARSVKFTRTDSGATEELHVDGPSHVFDLGALGMGDSDRWNADITLYSDPAGDVDGSTAQSTRSVIITGPTFSNTDPTIEVTLTAPTAGDDTLNIHVVASAGGSYEIKIFERHVEGAGSYSSWSEKTATVTPTPGAPPTGAGTTFGLDTGYSRVASPKTNLITFEVRVEVRTTPGGAVVDSKIPPPKSWYYTPS